jgi:hypothetical protein
VLASHEWLATESGKAETFRIRKKEERISACGVCIGNVDIGTTLSVSSTALCVVPVMGSARYWVALSRRAEVKVDERQEEGASGNDFVVRYTDYLRESVNT